MVKVERKIVAEVTRCDGCPFHSDEDMGHGAHADYCAKYDKLYNRKSWYEKKHYPNGAIVDQYMTEAYPEFCKMMKEGE